MSNIPRLESEYSRFTELRRRLIEADPDIDEKTLLDTLEGATDLHEAIAVVLRSALDDGALANALKSRIEVMRERLDRIEATSARKRKLVLDVMEETGIEKIIDPDFTVSLRVCPPSIVVTNEADIPASYWVQQPAKLDRRRLLDALRVGAAVNGVTLSNSGVTLAIRTK